MTDDRYNPNMRRIPPGANDEEMEQVPWSDVEGSDDDSEDESDWEFEDADTVYGGDTDEEAICDIRSDSDTSDTSDRKYGADHEIRHFEDSAMTDFLELLFQLSVTLSKQKFIDGEPGSTLLVYFSGIFGFSSDYRRFMLARQFCPSLSGIIYVQWLLFLEYALPLFAYGSLGLRQRPRVDQLEHFKNKCDRYIVAGSPSALAELFSLRSFGYKVGKTEAPAHMLKYRSIPLPRLGRVEDEKRAVRLLDRWLRECNLVGGEGATGVAAK